MPTRSEIRTYYNDRNMRVLLRDYVLGNMRFKRAVQFVVDSVPPTVKRILDIGCGIGYSSWLFKEAFPKARILSVDVSDKSIEVAKRLFDSPNISFQISDLSTPLDGGPFNLVVMIDVYEHIPRKQWPSLHLTLKNLIDDDGWLVITTPTIEHQAFLRESHPEGLQIVDEDVTLDDFLKLAKDVSLTVVRLERVAIWNTYDYQHFVAHRLEGFKEAPLAQPPGFIPMVKRRLKKIVGADSAQIRRRRVQEILGFDPLIQEQNGPRNE